VLRVIPVMRVLPVRLVLPALRVRTAKTVLMGLLGLKEIPAPLVL
jgi:hypothetical protein